MYVCVCVDVCVYVSDNHFNKSFKKIQTFLSKRVRTSNTLLEVQSLIKAYVSFLTTIRSINKQYTFAFKQMNYYRMLYRYHSAYKPSRCQWCLYGQNMLNELLLMVSQAHPEEPPKGQQSRPASPSRVRKRRDIKPEVDMILLNYHSDSLTNLYKSRTYFASDTSIEYYVVQLKAELRAKASNWTKLFYVLLVLFLTFTQFVFNLML